MHTDGSWRVTDRVQSDDWKLAAFDDSAWAKAADLGPLGIAPWTGAAWASGDPSGRFTVPEGFAIACVAPPELTGSVVAMNFDAKGRPCVSVERGPILRLIDKDGDGAYDDKVAIAPAMSNCQGSTFHKGDLLAVGLGPEGTGVYRLADKDGDGVYESPALIRASTGPMQEHGLHAIAVGPGGSLYLNNGNHAHLAGEIDPASPMNLAYEGELLPHLNDPRGHAAGIKAPAGEILRSDDDGKTWSRVAAGFRNHYDFAFNLDGEPFTFDSDMEWDLGLPWYRPTRILHAMAGADFGSRNGSAVWPSYFVDGVPPVLDVGRGSPTGVTFYQARAFPPSYSDNLLACDWSQGRILAVALTEEGGTYAARARTLVSGQPLNCTDVEVGPDGAVYFSTGGRGTLGGLYRVAYTAPLKPYGPATVPYTNEAIAMESPRSSFGRARIAAIRDGRAGDWGRDLLAIANDPARPPFSRARALDLLAEFGPPPAVEALARLATDGAVAVRRGAVRLLGAKGADAAKALAIALADPDPFVRRLACEGFLRSGGAIPIPNLAPLLDDPDRSVRHAAQVAIEHGGPMPHGRLLVNASSKRARIGGMLAMVRASTLDEAAQDELLARELFLWEGGSQLTELIDLIRLTGLTYQKGPRKPEECKVTPHLRGQLVGLLERLPASPPAGTPVREHVVAISAGLRCEAARLLAFLGEPKAVPLLLKLQKDEPDPALQIHYAYCLRVLKEGWTAADKAQEWAWIESASRREGGYSVLGYLDFLAQDLVALLSPQEASAFLSKAAATPFPARMLVRGLDLDADPGAIAGLARLYADLSRTQNAQAAHELRTLIVEKLGQSAAPEAHAAIRDLVKADPGRRDQAARALGRRPVPDDLPVLVSALESRDPDTTSQVVSALIEIDARPAGPDGPRDLLRLARRTGPAMHESLNRLGRKWMGDPAVSRAGDKDFRADLAAWQEIYRRTFPSGPPLDDPSGGQNAYTLAQLLAGVLQSPARRNASADRGNLAIAKARCLDCHKLGDRGQALGPDLTTVASRFRPGEILESIAEPSKVVSDQYRSVAVATVDGKTYTGLPAGRDEKNLVLLLPDGTKATIARADIEEEKESRVSVMPAGLLDGLSYQEIADLLALLEAQPRAEAKK